jgi:3-dehydroquinate dehydratase-2
MPKKVLVINGPNLNLLGKRQPEIYGHDTLADAEAQCSRIGTGLAVTWQQSNDEAAIIGLIHDARNGTDGLIINAGAFSHTSLAIADALRAFDGPVIEVHVSNIHAREQFRHHSWISAVADGVIVGCGIEGYALALRRLASLLP